MKIDIHCHTKKIKSGDPDKRGISSKDFINIIKETDVRIVAITNHNEFDEKQYKEIIEKNNDGRLIWPGVELDVIQEDGSRCHIIVVSNPKEVDSFKDKLDLLIKKTEPDDFTCKVSEMVKAFEGLDCIYIAHYYNKKPDTNDETIEYITNELINKTRILKEANNYVSAGIFVNHGHRAIYGSDIQNWEKYLKKSEDLPKLKFSIDSFEQFCLLLNKDKSAIKTVLDSKKSEVIEMKPFENSNDSIKIDIFDDINILFGPKGTGKSDILKGIEKYYISQGKEASVYKSNDVDLNSEFDIKCKNIEITLKDYKIDDCKKDISSIKSYKESDVTSIEDYFKHFLNKTKNKIANEIEIKDISTEIVSSKEFETIKDVELVLSEQLRFISEGIDIKDLEIDEEIEIIKANLGSILSKLYSLKEKEFNNIFITKMLNSMVESIKKTISINTGSYPKPSLTGFYDFAKHKIDAEVSVKNIIENLSKPINKQKIEIGDLLGKGKLEMTTEVLLQNGKISNSLFDTKGVSKNNQKKIAKNIKEVFEKIYTNKLASVIGELNEVEEEFNSLNDLIICYRYFSINDKQYNPSTGESSMIMLQSNLKKDREIIILDEPERSLGNDYVSDVVVPLLQEKARLGKKIIIATHDANIAIRTLPYNTIYREHDNGEYSTYSGNPFVNELFCEENDQKKDWKETSMKTLEGGREAFGERGIIYGRK